MSYKIIKKRSFYNYLQDGTGGTDSRVVSSFNYVNISRFDGNILNIIYYDISNNQIRLITGLDPILTFTNYVSLTNPPVLMSFIFQLGFIIDTSNILYYINEASIISSEQLSNSDTNLKIIKSYINTNCYVFLISKNHSIYQLTSPTQSDSIPLVLLVEDDYNGNDFSTFIDHINNFIYIAYTSDTFIKIIKFTIIQGVMSEFITIDQNSKVVIATFTNSQNNYTSPKIIIFNNILQLFIKNTNNYLFSTFINNETIHIMKRLFKCLDYKLNIVNNKLILYYIGLNNTINRLLFQFKTRYYTISQISNNIDSNVSFDIANINNEEYIYYTDTNGKLHQSWNPIPFITIKFNSLLINSVTGNTNDSGNSILPAFNTSISDYTINTTLENTIIGYNLIVNSINISDTIYPGQSIQLIDNNNTYYIKILPVHIECAVTNKYADYIPGYYLTASSFGIPSNYYTIYDSNGVPVWYKKNNSTGGTGNNPQICSLFLGNDINTVVTDIFDGSIVRKLINVDDLTETNYQIQPDSLGGQPTWDVHEALVLKAPLNRYGNMLLVSYTNPFYLQEISSDNTRVWEWFASEYLNDQGNDYYHINSIDVHPTTGHLVLSARNCSTIFSIDYDTKKIRWIINVTGAFTDQLIDSTDINILTPSNEPTEPTNPYTYNGTQMQHDARWHVNIAPLTPGNEIISAYDDQSVSQKPARGVIYEIDLTNNNAIFRGMVYGLSSSGYMGSYKIIDEPGGSTSHVCDWVQMHPCLGEYSSDTSENKMPTQNQLFNLDLAGDHYRISKGTSNDLSITSMRNTSGMPFTTI